MADRTRARWLSARAAACLLLGLSGVVHLSLTIQQHPGEAPAHALFFAVLGTFQIGWAAAYWLLPTPPLRLCGYVLSGGMLALWGLTRFAAAPFQPGAEEATTIGLVNAALEGTAMAALLVDDAPTRRSRWLSVVGLAVGVSLASCLVIYASGLLAATRLPGLASTSSEESSAGRATSSEPAPGVAHTHGAARVIRLENARAGPYLVRVVTSPGTDRAENLAVEVRVLDAATHKTVTDAAVQLAAVQAKSGAKVASTAVQGAAAIPRDYGARLELPTAGGWNVTVLIDGPAGGAETAFDLQVASSSGIGAQISAYLPFAGLLLLVLAYYLVTRVRTASAL